MNENSYKKINIGQQYLNYSGNSKKEMSGKKKRNNENIVNLKPQNVKELLLQKLKQYKKEKSRKKKMPMNPMLDVNFLEKVKRNNTQRFKNETNNNAVNNAYYNSNQTPLYGNLKNGTKPTWNELTEINNTIHAKTPPTRSRKNVEIEKKYNIGRNLTQKKVGVFIKNNELRKKISHEKENIKKSNIRTVKQYLKKRQLIKYGTSAPNELLREIYSNTKLCGEVFNVNGTSLLHNYINK